MLVSQLTVSMAMLNIVTDYSKQSQINRLNEYEVGKYIWTTQALYKTSGKHW